MTTGRPIPLTEFTPRATAGMDARSAKNSRNPGIDLPRWSSILFVILNHLYLRIPLKKTGLAEALPGRFLNRLNENGCEAVFVCFVISGVLVAGNALQR